MKTDSKIKNKRAEIITGSGKSTGHGEANGITKAAGHGKGPGTLIILAYIYAFLPVVLFSILWLKWFLALPLAIAVIYGIYSLLKGELPLTAGNDSSPKIYIIVALAIICLWVLSSGIGASVVQYPDHLYRNEIFKILIDEPWPVRDIVKDGTERGMVYYIGFWLPGALIGKLTSYSLGLLFLQAWAILGIFLIWNLICENQGKRRVWYLIPFIFFGGWDIVGRWLTGELYQQTGNSLEWWAIFFNYPGNSTHLFWAYNQVIYGWLIYLLIMRQKGNKGILLIWSTALLSCTFPAVGLIPFAIYKGIENGTGERTGQKFKSGLRSALTLQNLIGLIVSLVLMLYLLPNDTFIVNIKDSGGGSPVSGAETEVTSGAGAGTGIESEGGGDGSGVVISVVDDQTVITGLDDLQEQETDGFLAYRWTTRLWMYLWFILLEIGIYYFLIHKSGKRNPLYWISLAVLLIVPLIKVGYYLDFCERASIPAMLCFFELILTALQGYKEEKKYILLAGLIAALTIGGLTTFDTVRGTMAETAQVVENLVDDGENVVPEKVSKSNIMSDGTFSATTDKFFYRYLAKGGAD